MKKKTLLTATENKKLWRAMVDEAMMMMTMMIVPHSK